MYAAEREPDVRVQSQSQEQGQLSQGQEWDRESLKCQFFHWDARTERCLSSVRYVTVRVSVRILEPVSVSVSGF